MGDGIRVALVNFPHYFEFFFVRRLQTKEKHTFFSPLNIDFVIFIFYMYYINYKIF